MWRAIASGDIVSRAVVVVSTISRVIVSGLWCWSFYEGKVYVNDVMGDVYRWSELMLLRKGTMELRDRIF